MTSWRDAARKHMGILLTEAVGKGLNKKQFKRLLTDQYPWERVGCAYQSWCRERKICLEYFGLIKEQSLPASGFEIYSLKKLGKQDAAKQQAILEKEGQLTLPV